MTADYLDRCAKRILQIELYDTKALQKKCPRGINDTFKVLKINMCHQGSNSDDATVCAPKPFPYQRGSNRPNECVVFLIFFNFKAFKY